MQFIRLKLAYGVLTIEDTKNKHPHVLPVTPLINAMLEYRSENSDKSKFVFRVKGTAGHITSFQKTLNNICKAADVPLVSAHDLRRTFATILNTIGVGHADTKLLLNHKTKDITSQYIQADKEHLRNILKRVVDFYDVLFPVFASFDDSFEPYATGALRYKIYNSGELNVIFKQANTHPNPEEEEDRPWW